MDKQALFTEDLPEADVELSRGGTVRVRALNRIEAMLAQQPETYPEQERRIIRYGMVDPPMTEKDAGRWQRASRAGELEAVVTRISELSGLLDGSSKSGLPGLRGEPGDGVRVLPGEQAGDDGEPAAPVDEQ